MYRIATKPSHTTGNLVISVHTVWHSLACTTPRSDLSCPPLSHYESDFKSQACKTLGPKLLLSRSVKNYGQHSCHKHTARTGTCAVALSCRRARINGAASDLTHTTYSHTTYSHTTYTDTHTTYPHTHTHTTYSHTTYSHTTYSHTFVLQSLRKAPPSTLKLKLHNRISTQLPKKFWNTIAALMRPLHHDLRCPAAKDNSITHAAVAPSNLDAAITMRSADTELQDTLEPRAKALKIAAPKLDLDAKGKKKHDFEELF